MKKQQTNINNKQISIRWILGIIICTGVLTTAHAEPESSLTEDDAPEQEAVKTNSKKIKKPEKGKETDKEGDTYNFYFQKSPGSNKVQQGKGSQSVEQSGKEQSSDQSSRPSAVPPAKEKPPVVDLYGGPIFLPGKSGMGLTVGGDFSPKSNIGIKLGLFIAQGKSETQRTQSQTSIFDSTESSTSHTLFGGDVGAVFNLVNTDRVKVAPLAGILLLSDSSATKSTSQHFWGSDDSNSNDSNFRIYPYLGMSGTMTFNRNLGMNITLSVPLEPKYMTASVGVVWRI